MENLFLWDFIRVYKVRYRKDIHGIFSNRILKLVINIIKQLI